MKCFDLYEAGDLKSQNLTSKQLMTKPEVKQTQFQCLLPLDEHTQKELLLEVISKKLSLKELKKICEKKRKIVDLRQKFVHLTNCKDWKDAETKFPIHANPEKLEQFLALNIKKSTPQVFSQYCAAAVLWSTNKEHTENVTNISNINHCTFVEVSELGSLDPSVITSGIKNFKGGSLFVFYMGKVRSIK